MLWIRKEPFSPPFNLLGFRLIPSFCTSTVSLIATYFTSSVLLALVIMLTWPSSTTNREWTKQPMDEVSCTWSSCQQSSPGSTFNKEWNITLYTDLRPVWVTDLATVSLSEFGVETCGHACVFKSNQLQVEVDRGQGPWWHGMAIPQTIDNYPVMPLFGFLDPDQKLLPAPPDLEK